MQNLERRVAALENQTSTTDTSVKLVFVQAGETRADALKRAGLPPDTADVMHVVFVSSLGERL